MEAPLIEYLAPLINHPILYTIVICLGLFLYRPSKSADKVSVEIKSLHSCFDKHRKLAKKHWKRNDKEHKKLDQRVDDLLNR